MNLFDKLKKRWGIDNNLQVLIILTVFAITGSTTVYLQGFIYKFFGVSAELPFLIRTIIWLVTILPVYNVLLFVFGTLLGQRKFFTWFLKKTFGRFIPGYSQKKQLSEDS